MCVTVLPTAPKGSAQRMAASIDKVSIAWPVTVKTATQATRMLKSTHPPAAKSRRARRGR